MNTKKVSASRSVKNVRRSCSLSIYFVYLAIAPEEENITRYAVFTYQNIVSSSVVL